MKKQSFFTSEIGKNFIDLSEQLRCCLESKLDEVSQKQGFHLYFNNSHLFAAPNIDEQHIEDIIGAKNNNKALAHRARIAVKTWFNMYYDDRISVLEKFRDCCYNSVKDSNPLTINVVPIMFCTFLIHELQSILSAPQWQSLNNQCKLN